MEKGRHRREYAKKNRDRGKKVSSSGDPNGCHASVHKIAKKTINFQKHHRNPFRIARCWHQLGRHSGLEQINDPESVSLAGHRVVSDRLAGAI